MKGYTTADMKRFNYLISETNAVYHEAAQKMGLSDSTEQVLYTICNYGESCQIRDICKLSGISKQTINSALRKLESEGILYLEASDGRKKRVCLTEKGKKLAEETVVKLIEIENGILNSWTGEEREQYLELTKRYLDSFREKVRELEAGGTASELAEMAESGSGAISAESRKGAIPVEIGNGTIKNGSISSDSWVVAEPAETEMPSAIEDSSNNGEAGH